MNMTGVLRNIKIAVQWETEIILPGTDIIYKPRVTSVFTVDRLSGSKVGYGEFYRVTLSTDIPNLGQSDAPGFSRTDLVGDFSTHQEAIRKIFNMH